ncbi:hypothetical protein M885DRAFT_517989 [Pelagophyceae sp. CCMP2097]|nr:hypothetical protein M885DRAFT_517989 [Pelagophyceae sp. CCMP2097]
MTRRPNAILRRSILPGPRQRRRRRFEALDTAARERPPVRATVPTDCPGGRLEGPSLCDLVEAPSGEVVSRAVSKASPRGTSHRDRLERPCRGTLQWRGIVFGGRCRETLQQGHEEGPSRGPRGGPFTVGPQDGPFTVENGVAVETASTDLLRSERGPRQTFFRARDGTRTRALVRIRHWPFRICLYGITMVIQCNYDVITVVTDPKINSTVIAHPDLAGALCASSAPFPVGS